MKLKLSIFLLLIFNFLVGFQIVSKVRDIEPALYFLYVGQGDSELIDLKSVNIMIDGGPDMKTEEELSKVIGKETIDILIITHPHNDHFYGLKNVLAKREVRMILWSGIDDGNKDFKELLEVAARNKVKILTIQAGSEIKYLGYKIRIISPGKRELADQKLSLNSKSIVAVLSFLDKEILYPGDLDSKEEEALEKENGLRADILKVSHHGSSGSSSSRFLSILKPRIAVISAGRRNIYLFPKEDVLKRLTNAGAVVYRLDELGSIKIIKDGDSLKIISVR